MFGSVVNKVMWVGRATVFLVGLTVTLALVLGLASMAFGANGQPFLLGRGNLATVVTRLTGNADGSAMQVTNNNAGANDTALTLNVQPGEAPMRVNSDAAVANLNADELDGQDSGDLAKPRGYAHVRLQGGVDPVYPSRGVNDVIVPVGQPNLYCFDLAFTPDAAVGSPFLANSAVVATVTPPNAQLTSSCPDTHQDAAVRTFASQDGTAAPINFQIVFV
jgi:hypothetical protein